MNLPSAIPKAAKLIKQMKILIDDFKAIKCGIERIHDLHYDVDNWDKDIKLHKISLNKVIYIVQNELDDIKVKLDSILGDMDCKECDDWKEYEE